MLIDPAKVRDISPEALDDAGRLKVLPADFWAATTPQERALFGHRHGLYGFPTIELVDHLRAMIGDRSAIEIGAGHGVLAEALDIPATDSRQQDDPKYRRVYLGSGQPPVHYGDNIIKMDAAEAVRHYRPDVVIAQWVTHRWRPDRHHAGGNEVGVDEEDILEHCSAYIFIGNRRVHKDKGIWTRLHSISEPSFVFSRSVNGSPDFIAVWPGRGKATSTLWKPWESWQSTDGPRRDDPSHGKA